MTAKAALLARPTETTLTFIWDKWKILILWDLMPGTERFRELKKSVGNVSQKVLTAQLRAMEESGLVNRKVCAEVSPKGGAFSDGTWQTSEAHSGFLAGMG